MTCRILVLGKNFTACTPIINFLKARYSSGSIPEGNHLDADDCRAGSGKKIDNPHSSIQSNLIEHDQGRLHLVASSTKNYPVVWAPNIQSAMPDLDKGRWDILLMLSPTHSTNELKRIGKVREKNTRLGIIVAANLDVKYRINGFRAGVDNYLPTPIDFLELQAIIDRRQTSMTANENSKKSSVSWHINQQCLQLICPDMQSVEITVTELALLELLLSKAGDPISRHSLCDLLPPGGSANSTRRLDSILSRLRSKIKNHAGHDLPIHTLRNQGYRFAIDATN